MLDSQKLAVGDKVRHPTYGAGVVKQIFPYPDGDGQATVLFDKHGTKRLLLSLAKLERLGSDNIDD